MDDNQMTCDPERIELFLGQKLADEEQTAFELHLDDCNDCRRRLEEKAARKDVWLEVRDALLGQRMPPDCLPSGDSALDSPTGGDAPFNHDTVLKLLAPTDDDRMIGRLGTYEVVGVIGSGGMGVVLKAFDAALNRYVAIKVLAPHLGSSGAARKRFAREAQAAAAVVHEAVIEIHGVADVDGLPYLVMPYVRGPSLQRRLDDEGPLALVEILRIAVQAAAGLAAAHAQGLVHRDVKPANILLADGVERVKLTDFGLARAADDAGLTKTGVIAGTPQYMSPEQARGESVDQRSDLFSLGSVLYAMCTGRAPFRAETSYGVLRRITDDEPRPIREINPDVPEWLCRIIARLMSKQPDDRFGSAREVAELLEECLAHVQQPTAVALPAAVPAPSAHRVSKPRNTLWKGTVAMLATLGIVLLGMFLVQSTGPPDIAGRWSGEGWGRVVLAQTANGKYAGTYDGTGGKQPGKIRLRWSRIQRRFNGTWRESDDRFGELSVRLAEHGIVGARTIDPKVTIDPSTPRLAELAWRRVEPTTNDADAMPTAPAVGDATSAAEIAEVAVDIAKHPNGPWAGRLPNGVTAELLAVGESDRWWQPNGSPLAAPPFELGERRSQPAKVDFTRRAFIARISGVPLPRAGMNCVVEPGSGPALWIGYEDIRKVPTRSYFSGIEIAVPTAAPKVTLRWGISTGPWEDAARVVFDAAGRPLAPGSSGDRLNLLRVLGVRGGTEVQMPSQPHYEERAIAIGNDGHELIEEFHKSDGKVQATFFDVKTRQLGEIKLQRRPYAWVEFRDVPTKWSDTPIPSDSAPPNTCNVAAQPTGPWLARLPGGVTVELVGVGEDERWWRPDGSPLLEPPCRFESRAKPEEGTRTARRFLLRLNGLPAQPAGIVAEVAPEIAPQYPENIEQNGQVIANRVNVLAFETRVPSTSQTVTRLRCGVAVGPWRESTSPSVNLYPTFVGGGCSSGRGNVSLHAEETKEGVVARVSEDWRDEDDLRLVAITYDGRAITAPAQIDHPKNERTQTIVTATLPGLTLRNIKELNVERRPYAWGCFSYVAVQSKPSERASAAPSRQDDAAVQAAGRRPEAGERTSSSKTVETELPPRTTAATPKRLHHFTGLTTGNDVTIACSADGNRIAVANGNPTRIMGRRGVSRLKDDWKPSTDILDADTGKTLVSLKLSTPDEDAVLAATERVFYFEVTALAFSPDGNVVAVGTSIGQVRLFNARTGELLRSLDDEQAKLADEETPESWKSLRRAMGSVASLAFSPDGSLLATCGGSFADFAERFDAVRRMGFRSTGPGRLKVWDVKTGTLNHDLVGHNNHANAVAFSPDGHLLASAGRWLKDRDFGNGVIVWNPHTGTQIHRLIRTTASGGIRAIAFSPDGKLLAMGTQRFDSASDTSTGGVSLVHASSGITQWLVTVPGWAKPVAFSPDGKSVAVLCGGRSIRFLETETGLMKHEIRPADSLQDVRWDDFAIAKRGRMLAIGGVDNERKGSVEVWSTRSSDNANEPPAAESPVGPVPTTATSERVRNLTTGASVRTIALSADGRLVAAASGGPSLIMEGNGRSRVEDDWRPSVDVLDAKTGKTVASLKLTTADEDAVLAATERVSHFEVGALALSPDGNVVAVGTSVGQVKLFNARTGDLVRSLDDKREKLTDKKTPEKWKSLRRAMGSVASFAFSPDGSLLATCGRSFDDSPLVREGLERLREFSTGPGRLKVWEVKTGTLKHDLVGHSHAHAVSFSPEESLLASAGRWLSDSESGSGVILWNAQTGAKLRTILTEANGGAHSVAFSPDGRRLAISSLHFDLDKANDAGKGAITVAHAASGVVQWRRTLSRMAKPVGFFSGEDSLLALYGGSMQVFDAETGEILAAFAPQYANQGARYNDIAIAKRGRMLAIGGVDSERKGSVELWDFLWDLDGPGPPASSAPVKDSEN